MDKDKEEKPLEKGPLEESPGLKRSVEEQPLENGEKPEFIQITNEFKTTLASLTLNEKMSKFKDEYEKIYKSIYRSIMRMDNSKEVIKKLEIDTEENNASNEKSIKLLEKESSSLAEVENQKELNLTTIEEMLVTEETMKENLRALKKQISDMLNAIKDGIQLSPEQQDNLQDLVDYKLKLTYELEEDTKRIVVLRNSVTDAAERIRIHEIDKRKLEVEIYDLKEKDTVKRSDMERENKNKEFQDKELKAIRGIVSNKQQESKSRLEVIARYDEEISILQLNIKNQAQSIEQFGKERDKTEIKMARIVEESKDHLAIITLLSEGNTALEKEIKEKSAKQNSQKTELRKILKQKEEAAKKVATLDNQKTELESHRTHLRTKNEQLAIDVEIGRKTVDIHKRSMDDLVREKGLMLALIQKSEVNTNHGKELLSIYSKVHLNLDYDLQRQKKTNSQYTEKIRESILQKDHIVNLTFHLQTSYLSSIALLKEKEKQISDFRKKMTEVEVQIKRQQTLYEAVQNDRNIHSKHLLESQTEISQMKRKLKTMYFQINNYKEEIKSKNSHLQKEITENQKLIEDIKTMNLEIFKLKHQNELSIAYARKQTIDESALIQFLKGADFERSRQDQALHLLYGERDNLNNNIIKQNMELSKVYSELRVIESNLQYLEVTYIKTCNTLNVMENSVLNLRQERQALKIETSCLKDLNHIISQLEYEVMNEQLKYNTMARESLIPINIHRWRTLENSNPKLYEVIQTAQTLQRKVIKKNSEEKIKESMIQSQEKIYLQLRSVYSKQVGSEVLEQIKQFQEIVNEKCEHLKSLTYELKMHEAQTREHQYRLEQLDILLVHYRKQYVSIKMKNFNLDDAVENINKRKKLPPLPSTTITAGIILM